jgi:hypothetical protein
MRPASIVGILSVSEHAAAFRLGVDRGERLNDGQLSLPFLSALDYASAPGNSH